MSAFSVGVGFEDIEIDGGFWKERQRINAEVSIHAVWDRFKETGRFAAFACDWKEDQPGQPQMFWDSDVAKWMEAAAYIIAKRPDQALERAIDEVVGLIEKHQDPSGYFNVYFTVVEPEERFRRRDCHELYCAGHLIEAAVAYRDATGKDKFLGLMRRYADHIEKVFKIDRSAAYSSCGHEEIELALVRLYRATGEVRYLELARHFVDVRGTQGFENPYLPFNARYAQDHLPVRRQTTAEGHAVRALYLYCAMADIARECRDGELLAACERIFENIATRRMYVTGGVGSSHEGEAFTIDYDLPNVSAYAESCAAIGLALFARRMQELKADSAYADVAERVLYNGFLSSVSMDGKSFFYANPLELHPEYFASDSCLKSNRRLAMTFAARQEVFECSCCPPNVARFMASIGSLLYSREGDTLFVHQYIASTTVTGDGPARLKVIQRTEYPADGKVRLTIEGATRVALRVPYWCDRRRFAKDGREAPVREERGYAYIDLDPARASVIDAEFDMEIRLVEAAPEVQVDSGRVVLQRGPVLYCLEGVDNGELLKDLRVDREGFFELAPSPGFGLPSIVAAGWRRKARAAEGGLYRPAAGELVPARLTFIPYYAFANRGESEMVLWVLDR